ncbi:hypothetical protein RHIZ_02785 [Rhizobium skierniewicense]|uniref:hypothetical protein n=1 Tax=Rhizobium skierniewicense TaxID=984260 RepID=UPI001FAE3A29|nr:hypothetical protein [Rhizobium skierniewicense]MCI9864866.1 hypothetical protein [Rhizobium skierniewicense]
MSKDHPMLPPTDVYRQPFIIPIGHLTMQAARADQQLYTLCAATPFDGSPNQIHPSEAEKKARNWTLDTEKFVDERLSLIASDGLRGEAIALIDRFKRLRLARNRVVHDAIEVGIDFNGSAYALAVQYAKEQTIYLHTVTADQIAALAYEVYEWNQDCGSVLSRIREARP